MKAEDVRRLLEGQEDVITKPNQEALKFIRSLSCPFCQHGKVHEVVNHRKPFNENSVVPNYLAVCQSCHIEFEPYTGIQVSLPK